MSLDSIKADEGFVPWVYDDANRQPIVPGYTVQGHPTIWYGLCVEKGRMPKLPDSIPEAALEAVEASMRLELASRWPEFDLQPDAVKDALVNMAYNMGVTGVLGFKLMLAALERGDRQTAAANVINSAWHRDPRTQARAERIAAIIEGQ